MTDRSTLTRALPMLELAPAGLAAAPRQPAAPDDDRLVEYVPEARTLPRFHVWTLGCQMNRSDSEEMAGQAARRRLRRGAEPRDRRPRGHQHVRDPRRSRAEGHRAAGSAGEAQGREPGHAGRADRLLGPRARPGRTSTPVPGGGPVPAPRRGAGARRSAGTGLRAGADRGGRAVGRDDDRRADGGRGCRSPAGHARPGGRAGDRRARIRDRRLAADHLRLRQDVHLLHRAVQPRAGAEPAVRRHRRRGARTRRGRLSRGHAARPERQLVRPRPAARAALRARRRGTLGGPPARSGGAAGPRRAHPRDRRPADRRRPARHRPAALRDVAPVGPVGPADRGAGRLRLGVRAPPPARPVGLGRGAPPDGPPVHDRALSRAAGADPRGGPGHHRLDRRHRRVLRRDRGPVRGDARAARDRPLRPGLRRGLLAATRDAGAPSRRRRAGRRQAPPAQRAARASRKAIGLERNQAWLGREVAVLVDAIQPERAHGHDGDAPTDDAGGIGRGRGASRLSGRTRGNKLVHLAGDAALVGREVLVRIDHAGPYALRGALVGA